MLEELVRQRAQSHARERERLDAARESLRASTERMRAARLRLAEWLGDVSPQSPD
jgi:hypothetical protein